jgi:hypothetical protein
MKIGWLSDTRSLADTACVTGCESFAGVRLSGTDILLGVYLVKNLLLASVLAAGTLVGTTQSASAALISITINGQLVQIDTELLAQLIASGVSPADAFAQVTGVQLASLPANTLVAVYQQLSDEAQGLSSDEVAQLQQVADEVANQYAETSGATAQDLPQFASPT